MAWCLQGFVSHPEIAGFEAPGRGESEQGSGMIDLRFSTGPLWTTVEPGRIAAGASITSRVGEGSDLGLWEGGEGLQIQELLGDAGVGGCKEEWVWQSLCASFG